jgi:hypothetical protein
MPAYEVALFVGLVAAARVATTVPRIVGALATLIVAQALVLIAAGELGAHTGLEVPVAAVRACSIVTPLILFGITFRTSTERLLESPSGAQLTTG